MQKFSLNRPTARMIAALLLDAEAHGVAEYQAEDAILMLVGAIIYVPYGRERRWAALDVLAPRIARLLRDAGCDIRWVHDVDLPHIRAVRREIAKAHAWIDEHGTRPHVCVSLNTPELAEMWPPYHSWRRAVWEIVNTYRMDDVDRATSSIPLPRDVREALVGADS